jgi:hypothetical protein
MVKKKKIKKSIESYGERIREHEDKIKNYSGEEDYLIGYWEKEIEEFKKKKKEKEEKL